MPFDEKLADRVRDIISDERGYSEKKMFGGICFLLNGNMCCGVAKDELMLRVGADQYEKALKLPHAREMDFTGRPMKGMVFIGAEGIRTAAALKKCVAMAVGFTEEMPPKKRPD